MPNIPKMTFFPGLWNCKMSSNLSVFCFFLCTVLDELCHATLRHKKNLSAPSELCPFSKPDLVLTQSFNLLNSEDW